MKAARLISYILHPLWMSVIGVFIMMHSGSWLSTLAPEAKRYVFLVVGVTTILLPLSVMPVLKSRGWIQSYHLRNHKDRRIPLLVGSFFYLIAAYILHRVKAPMIIPLFLNASAIVILLCALLTWRWKISIHMAALGSLFGLALALSLRWMVNLNLILMVILLITGMVGSTRLRLNLHRPWEIYVGFLIGIVVNFFLILFI